MEIYAKLLQHKYLLGAAIALLLSVSAFATIVPNLSSIVLYFWPLFLSTALVIVAIVVIGQISPMPRDFCRDGHGQALLDYVAGHPEMLENY